MTPAHRQLINGALVSMRSHASRAYICTRKQALDLIEAVRKLSEQRQTLEDLHNERWKTINAFKWGVWWNERAGAFIVQTPGQVVGNIGSGRTAEEAIDDAIRKHGNTAN